MKKTLLLLSMLSIGSIGAVRVENDTNRDVRIQFFSPEDGFQTNDTTLAPLTSAEFPEGTILRAQFVGKKFAFPLHTPPYDNSSSISIKKTFLEEVLAFTRKYNIKTIPSKKVSAPKQPPFSFFFDKENEDSINNMISEMTIE